MGDYYQSAEETSHVGQNQQQGGGEDDKSGLTYFRMFKHDVCLFLLFLSDRSFPASSKNESGQLAKVKSKEQVLRQSAESVSALEKFICAPLLQT